MVGWIPDITELILYEALKRYKTTHGYTDNKSIDMDKLTKIIKEIKDAATSSRKTPK